jgi:hypothetical protein
MKHRISRIHAAMVASAIAGLPLFSLNAVAQIAVSSMTARLSSSMAWSVFPRSLSTTPSP